MHKYAVFALLIAIIIGVGCNLLIMPMNTEKPKVVLALGQTPEEVQMQSTQNIPWSLALIGGDRHGAAFISPSHSLSYRDDELVITFPDIGGIYSIPTVIGISNGRVWNVELFALKEYVSLDKAIAYSEDLLQEFQRQGFIYQANEWARFGFLDSLVNTSPPAPQAVGSFQEMADVFLNSNYFAKEFIVFQLQKDKIDISLRIVASKGSEPFNGYFYRLML